MNETSYPSKAEAKIDGYYLERLVADEMRDAGFTIIEQNYKVGHLEVDIIALDGDQLCFVEVKSRKKKEHLRDLDVLVSPKKEQNLVQASDVFCRTHPHLKYRGVRFDYAIVYASGKGDAEVIYIKKAFIPGCLKNF